VTHVAHRREMENAHNILVEKPEVKRSFGRHKHIWEDNIRMDLRETGWESMDWMHLTQGRD